MVKLKSFLRKFYWRVGWPLWNTVSQMISDMFLTMYVVTTIPFPFMNVTYGILRLFTGFVLTWATRRVPNVKQDLLTLMEHLRSPPVFGGVCVAYSLVLYVVSCVLLTILFVFFIFSHGVVSLFSIYEFDCPSGIFHPSFQMIHFYSSQPWLK